MSTVFTNNPSSTVIAAATPATATTTATATPATATAAIAVSSATAVRSGAVAVSSIKPDTAAAASAPVTSAVAASAPVTPITATASATATTSVIGPGPLPRPLMITITFKPDWSQGEIRSPLRAASLFVLLGPPNTLPQQAKWCIEFNIFADKPHERLGKDDGIIGKGARALLWYDGKAFPTYKNCIVFSKCSLPANDKLNDKSNDKSNDELKTESIALRVHDGETDPLPLVLMRKRGGYKRRRDLSCFRVITGHKYHLNITFGAGSTIAEKVATEAWRPIFYLYTKRQKSGIDEIQSSRQFTNFTTNWVVGIEPPVHALELKMAAEALQREAEEDKEDKEDKKITEQRAQAMAASQSIKPPTLPPAAGEVRRDYDVKRVLDVRRDYDVKRVLDVKSPGYTPTSAPIFSPPYQTKAAAAYQESLSPLAPRLSPSSWTTLGATVPVEWSELEAAINSKPLASIVLPAFDSNKPFNPDFSLDPPVIRFQVGPEEPVLVLALGVIEVMQRTLSNDSKSPLKDVATCVLNVFAAIAQLPGWLHLQRFILSTQDYIKPPEPNQKSTIAKGSIDDLQARAIMLMRRLCQRIDWVLGLQRKANAQFNAEFYVKVIAADRAWAEDASSFMNETKTKVEELKDRNPAKFNAFRELQRKGVQWPHSPGLKTEIERAGFVFRPSMFKRDRCICETCLVEVSGWRPWHSPWSFHDYAKHPPSFQPGVALTLRPPTSPFLTNMVTESNMKHGGATARS